MTRMNIKKKRNSHPESVNALFDKIAAIISPNEHDTKWLSTMRQRALRKMPDWKAALDAYLHGLAAGGHVSHEETNVLKESVAKCASSRLSWEDFLFSFVWIVCIAAMSVTRFALSENWLLEALMFGLTAGAGGWWVSKQPWLNPINSLKQGQWERPFFIIFGAVLISLLIFSISDLVGKLEKYYSIQKFNTDRAAFMADPQGFPMLRNFALSNYGIEVVLGDVYDSWASTTVKLPGSSIASMSLRPGYCVLSIDRENVLREFGPIGKVNETLWLQGVMMHEFGHCLDMLRDLPRFGEHTVQVHSIAPVDAKRVKDLESYLTATDEASTTLWREAVADIFAIGFWRLTSPTEAKNLAASLRHNRSSAANRDKTHTTMCWIDHAMKAAPPESIKRLMDWADQQRSAAACPIYKPSK